MYITNCYAPNMTWECTMNRNIFSLEASYINLSGHGVSFDEEMSGGSSSLVTHDIQTVFLFAKHKIFSF